ncbi:MAG: ABC transporter ATP-binding protein [Rhodospirillaceae bacterium]|nr:ABC transporter ATP-binding protein [Rhodospirillaceae bacterium]
MSTQPIVDIRDLHVHYGSSHILHGINLTIGAGECICLLGRNGMGKTTTVRSLFGLAQPSAGNITIFGDDRTGVASHIIARQGLALVSENRDIFPNLTVMENLVMAARVSKSGSREWSLEKTLSTFPKLTERLDHMGDQLSGGEQQMLAIGRALMTNPELLVLDEATEGLAPMIRDEIWSMVRAIRATGMATLIIDKNISTLLDISDRAIILEKGRIVYEGSAQELAKKTELHARYLGV